MGHLKALDAQLAVLGETDVAAAEISSARGLAALLDNTPDLEWAWREYRFALKALREVLDVGGVDESVQKLLGRLGRTDVRDAPHPR